MQVFQAKVMYVSGFIKSTVHWVNQCHTSSLPKFHIFSARHLNASMHQAWLENFLHMLNCCLNLSSTMYSA